MKLVIISGRSGSGKSISLRVLEDLGYYCVDNLPVQMLPDLMHHLKGKYSEVAISVDVRNLPEDSDQFVHSIQKLRHEVTCEIMYLDAEDTVLINRYSESRRKHPLSNKMTTLREALKKEHELLQAMVDFADVRIDTSKLSAFDLNERITQLQQYKTPSSLALLIQSFGYKYGVPADTDFAFDVRSLPNPYWVKALRPLNGTHEHVVDYLRKHSKTQTLIERTTTFIETLIPDFEANQRFYLSIAVGCTGGRHRSVFVAQEIYQYFAKQRDSVQIRHRDLQEGS